MMSTPRGYFQNLLVMDCETTGLAFNTFDPSIDPHTGDTYQCVSWGLVVADSKTLKPVDKLYVEIQWNGESIWDTKAQSVHGLSKAHLDVNGVDEETAAIDICEFIHKHFGPGGIVPCAGHNVTTFDIWFMRRLMNKFELMFKTGNRFVDTNSIGFAAYHTYNSDDLFELVGVVREDHNALEDAMATLQVIHKTRLIVDSLLG